MFSQIDIDYRSGILLTVGAQQYVFTRQFFMRYYVGYIQARMRVIPAIDKKPHPIELQGVDSFLSASQSITAGDIPMKQVDLDDPASHFTFVINGRNILCPHYSHCYVFDRLLCQQYPNYFKDPEISYIEISRFLRDKMAKERLSDVEVAEFISALLLGDDKFLQERDDDAIDVLPLMMAAIFLSESKRNPSCFLPNIMLLELILSRAKTPFGDLYTWSNSLQSDVLVCQEESDDFLRGRMYPAMADIPGYSQTTSSFDLDEQRKELLNAHKKYNRTKNQQTISGAEFLMQLGGYFPGSHRFSFTEIEPKRKEGRETLADIKSFIIISDWLMMYRLGQPICKHDANTAKYPEIDANPSVLMLYVFPKLWDGLLTGKTLDLTDPIPPFGYPPLLNAYGCTQRKATASKVANALFYIHGSKRHGPEIAQRIKQQFQFWSIDQDLSFGTKEVEEEMKKNYVIPD